MFVSLLANHRVIEEKSNNPDGNYFIYFILNTTIKFIKFLYTTFMIITRQIGNLKGFSYIYNGLNCVNNYYVQGRDQIISFMIQNSMNMIMNSNMQINPQVSNFEPNNTPKVENKKAFNSKNEMDDFLDSLVDKKNN